MADNLDDEWWEDSTDEKSKDGKPKDDVSDMEQDVEEKESPNENTETEKKKKKKRKRKKKNITTELNEKGDAPATFSDVTQYIKKQFDGKLTPVELDEIALDEEHFYKSESDPGFPVAYLKGILPKWKKLKKNLSGQGSPLLLIISSSAVRSVNLNRDITQFKGEDCKCAKLFAKHMKVEDQQKFLKKTMCHIALGTPNRIIALLKSDHLKLDKLKAILLDWNWRDVKQRRLMDAPEIKQEMLSLLKTYLIPIVKSEQHCKIGIL